MVHTSPDNIREVISFIVESYIEIFIAQKYMNIAMATAEKQEKLNIHIKSIKTPMSTMFTQTDDIYRSNILNSDNRRKLSSFSEVLKRKYLTLQRYEDQQENAMRCYNRNDLLELSFTLEISIFSEAYIYPSRTSMMELLLQK